MSFTSKPFYSSLVILFLCFKIHLSIPSDTISPGQSLTGNQTITSQSGIFELGFFTPGKSLNYYIGIWYKKIPVQTLVWVANRDKPLPNTSSELKLSEHGNLSLFNQSKIPIWSTNSTSYTSNYIVAVLLDSGNLVLRDRSGSSVVIWQSFEHPTDTWLPGGRLGMNKITGEIQHLASWKNSENPSPGFFSLEIDPEGSNQYYLIWNRTHEYWTSGAWNGKIFTLVPEMTSDKFFSFNYVSNEKESYFTYAAHDSSFLSRFVLGLTGQIKQFIWLNTSQEWLLFWARPCDRCETYSLCGPFGICNPKSLPFCGCLKGFEPRSLKDWSLNDWSSGCVRKTPLQCEDTNKKDGFLKMPEMQLPINPQNLTVGSVQQCELTCLKNCSCSAYSFSSGCSIWSGGLWNLKQLSDGDLNGGGMYLRLAASELPTSKQKKKKTSTRVIEVIVIGVVALFGVTFVLIWKCRRRRMMGSLKTLQGPLVPFRYRDLQRVTKNFAERLGGGGFGSVFKGTLPYSTTIAVKILEGLSQGDKQFRAEVSTIGTIQHVNLVHLRGFCSEGTQRLLVYDYMPNGSLDNHLFGKDSKILDWKIRFQIALGIARGLTYLHEKCRDCIIHCDVKPQNILLDAEFCPKISDFGMAKFFGRDFSRVLTTIRGTRGYLAPEWISGLPITPKADVYSYGMMLLEIISGKRNLEQTGEDKFDFIPIKVVRKLNSGEEVLSLLDYRSEGGCNAEEVIRACKVACWCIQDDEKDRPSMGRVVQILEGALEVSLPPIPLYLQSLVENHDCNKVFWESSFNENLWVGSNI